MKIYQITIGYKAVISVELKADNEEDAKEKGIKMFEKKRDQIFSDHRISLSDDRCNVDGIIDMSATYYMLDNE